MIEKDLPNGRKLKGWLAENDLKNGDLATHLHCHKQTITNYLSGNNLPSRATAVVIEMFTNGEIKADGWKR